MTDSHVPPEIMIDIVFDVIGACCAGYMRLAEAAPNAALREAMREQIHALRESRLSIDPHCAVEVNAALEAAEREYEKVSRFVAELDG